MVATDPADDPLRQPTRARLYERLLELRRAASTEELAGELGLHVNGVRRHLERLERAGLIGRHRARRGRGRPRDEWAPAPGAEPGGAPPRRYDDLARWLVRAEPEGPERIERLVLEGRAIGRELAPEGAGEVPARAFTDVLSALGFAPVLAPEGTDGVCCRLENCPYVEAVREGPDVVCSLHRGITEGLIEVLEPRARLARWEPRDPESAGCIAAIEGAPGWRRQLEEG